MPDSDCESAGIGACVSDDDSRTTPEIELPDIIKSEEPTVAAEDINIGAGEPPVKIIDQDTNNNDAFNLVGAGECDKSWSTSTSSIRVWCDGCYDMVHFGHANSLRQAKSKGGYLIVGLHSDEEITTHKGAPPVFTQEERLIMVKAIKWVDEIRLNVPYVTTVETLNEASCDFCCHGNDLTTTKDGVDTYQEDAKRYEEVERTQGVSTSGLIGTMLKCGTGHGDTRLVNGECDQHRASAAAWKRTPFLLTTQKLAKFRNPSPIPADAVVVYVAGTFDIPHPGHVKFLEAASKLGSHLIVGVHDDETVRELEGQHRPIMNVHQRGFSLLAFKYVSDVIFGAPYLITEELLDHLNVSIVVHGRTGVEPCPFTGEDPHLIARRRGIFQEIDSGSNLTTDTVIGRITSKQEEYTQRNKNKAKKEQEEAAAAASRANNLNLNPSASS